MKLIKLRILLLFLSLFQISFAGPLQLGKQDVRKTMQEMLDYHVEYKEFNQFLARRAMKLYIEQFDPDKVYLLASEAKLFLDLKEDQLQGIISKYKRDDLEEFESLNHVIQKAIARQQLWREELEKSLTVEAKENEIYGESYLDYAKSEAELKERVRKQLTRALFIEKTLSRTPKWTPHQREKVFALWERRYHRVEYPYVNLDSSGKKLSIAQSDHYLATHTLKAMAKSLDAHTSYFSPEEAHEMRASLEKQFEGIGVVLREGVDGVVIADLIKGGPADKSAQVAAGDLLVTIDGQSIEGAPYEEVLQRLQGDSSGKLKLGLKRIDAAGNVAYYDVDLKREKIVMQDERVQYSYEPFADGIIGKITLPSFYESGNDSSCEKDMREALRALKQQGKLYGVVLDMRENSGGFLNQAVKVAGLFITSGVVVISKYAQGEVQYLRAIDGRNYYDGPLVILTSRASASAAEIVAQALQDYGVALVVGDDRTYGKGTIQYQTVTDDRATSFFKVTVGRYYTVSGKSTQIEGVKADIVLPTFFSIYNIGERYLEYALKSDRIPSAYHDSLADIDPRYQRWFQQNYLPNLQKKLSVWDQMLPELKTNSAFRLKHDKNYKFFLESLYAQASGQFVPTMKQNFGVDDLQMTEAVKILKDMVITQTESSLNSEKGIAKNP
jgi:carboxyl-terminal processing protease